MDTKQFSRIVEMRYVAGGMSSDGVIVVMRQTETGYRVEWRDPWTDENKVIESTLEIESKASFDDVVSGLEEGLSLDRS